MQRREQVELSTRKYGQNNNEASEYLPISTVWHAQHEDVLSLAHIKQGVQAQYYGYWDLEKHPSLKHG